MKTKLDNMYRIIISTVLLFFGGTVTLHAQIAKTTNHNINLGQVVYRMPAVAEFELQNNTDSDIYIENVKTSCGCTKVDYPRQTIVKGQTFKIQATYDAKLMGHFEKQIGIYFSDNQSPVILTIKGVVVDEIHDFSGNYAFDMGDISIDKINLEFDDVNNGDRPFQEIHIRNNSDNAIQPVIMHLPPYLQAEVSPSTITPGRSGVARITLLSEQIKMFGLSQTTLYLGANPGDKVSNDKEITVSSVLLPNFDNLTSTELANAPQLELSDDEIVFDFTKKKKASAYITLRNAGKSLLEISSLQMFTSGLKVSLGNTRLQPGEETKMKVTANKKDLRNLNMQPRILMITNDPNNPKRIIQIK